MKTYGKKWSLHGCVIRQRGGSFQVEFNHNGNRERQSWPTLKEAKVYAKQKSIELLNEGVAAFDLSLEQRQDAAKAFKLLPGGTLAPAIKDYAEAIKRLENVPLKNAIDFYIRHHKPIGGIRTFSALMQEYIKVKEKTGRRKASISDIKCRLGIINKTFGDRHVHTIVARELEDWLDQKQYTGQTRINYLRILSGFFNYARKSGLIENNPADKNAIDRPKLDEHLPEIFTVGNVEALLRAAENSETRVLPFLCLGFFAGLRSSELNSIKWEDIDLTAKLITVRPEIAKMRRQRHITISENLVAWLLPYKKEHGKVSPEEPKRRKSIERILSATGIKWVHNGMRHSYASHHLALHKDINKTAFELGHTGGVGVLFNHYRNLVKPADAELYWNICPSPKGNTIPAARAR